MRPILLCLTLALATLQPVHADDKKEGKPFWLTAYTKKDASKPGARTIYFCGRAPFPGGTQVMIFLRFKGRIFKATQVRVGQRSTGYSQAKAYLGARAGGVNFGGQLGPIEKMALGEWELVCMVDRAGKSHRTSYSLVVGEVAEIIEMEKKVAARLGEKLKQLQQLFGQVKERAEKYAGTKSWTAGQARAWRQAAQREEIQLRKMSDQALEERSRQLAPLFPFVQTVLTQMPIKIRDLAANYYFLFRETRGGAQKPKFDRQEVIGRLEGEISANIKRAWASLNSRTRTTQEGLFLDLSKLENLVAELERQHERARSSSSFHAGIWNGMIRNGQRGADFLQRKISRYAGSRFGREHAETIKLFGAALGLYRTLADKYTKALYSRHQISEKDRLQLDAERLADARDAKTLRKELDGSLTAIRDIAHQSKRALRKELVEQLAMTMAAMEEVLAGYAGAQRGGAASFTTMMGTIKNRLGRMADDLRAKLTDEKLLYYPTAAHGVPALASGIVSLGDEIDKLLTTGEAKGTMKAHGYKVTYDRKEVIAMRANSAISIASDIYRELELTDYKALEKALAYLGKLQIQVEPSVKKKLAGLPRK